MTTESATPTKLEETMSLREKSAWICLITTVVVFLPYFIYVFFLFGRQDHALGSYIGAFVLAVFWQIILNAGAQIFITLRGGKEPKDERDVAIESKAFRNAYVVLVSLLWTVPFVSLPISGAMGQLGGSLLKGQLLLVSQFVLLSFVLAELAKYLTQVLGYRRGI